MNEEALKSIAAQLRQPHGEYAIQVGEKMNEGNLHINLNTIKGPLFKSGTFKKREITLSGNKELYNTTYRFTK